MYKTMMLIVVDIVDYCQYTYQNFEIKAVILSSLCGSYSSHLKETRRRQLKLNSANHVAGIDGKFFTFVSKNRRLSHLHVKSLLGIQYKITAIIPQNLARYVPSLAMYFLHVLILYFSLQVKFKNFV